MLGRRRSPPRRKSKLFERTTLRSERQLLENFRYPHAHPACLSPEIKSPQNVTCKTLTTTKERSTAAAKWSIT